MIIDSDGIFPESNIYDHLKLKRPFLITIHFLFVPNYLATASIPNVPDPGTRIAYSQLYSVYNSVVIYCIALIYESDIKLTALSV